jgi:hypothetical protein
MFKKSVLENTKQNPPVEGRQIFDGYASVRTSPRSPPPQLKQRLISGDDVILIWS